MSEMVERVARAMMRVTARLPAGDKEFPVLSMDPDFDDLPRDHTEGTVDDEITREAVMKLARAAIEEMREPDEEMLEAGRKNMFWGPEMPEVWNDMIDEALR